MAGPVQADAPLEDEGFDRLDRVPFATAVADTIARRSERSPIVIGIYGPWGDGKTTVLNWIRGRLDDLDPSIVVVLFNPWLIRDELTLLPSFFATLATAVGRRMGGKAQEVASVLKRYGGVLSGVNIGVPGVSVDPGKAAEALGTALADRTLDDLKAEFERLLREAGRRVLVIIDDVDRLDDAEIHAVFKLVKLAAAFEGITYLLAFDDEKVAAALAKRDSYSANGRGNEGGYDFLEKIVQVPLRLPRARKRALDAITLDALQAALDASQTDIEDHDAREFRVRYSEGLSPAITSVRTAKRFANAASFALPLLRGETNPSDVLSIEGISACYPNVYTAIREHPDWFLLPYEFHLTNREEELRTRRKERVESVFAGVEPNLQPAIQDLIRRVFPQTDSLWTNFAATNERADWAEHRRVCSSEYFDRYFSYAVSRSEVGDQELTEVIADADGIGERVSGLMGRKGVEIIDPLLRAIDRRVDSLNPDQASALSRAIASFGARVSGDSTPRFIELNLNERTARSIAQLLLQVPEPGSRNAVAREVIESAEPLTFAAECLRWFRLRRSTTDERRALDEGALKHLQVLLAQRIARFAETLDHPIWQEPGGFGLMYRARDGGKKDEMHAHVGKWLHLRPALVASLLEGAAGVAYGNLGIAIQQDLTKDKYKSLEEVADTRDVREAIISVRGAVPAPVDFPTLEYDRVAAVANDPRLLEQFVWQDARATEPPEANSTEDTNEAS